MCNVYQADMSTHQDVAHVDGLRSLAALVVLRLVAFRLRLPTFAPGTLVRGFAVLLAFSHVDSVERVVEQAAVPSMKFQC